MLFVENVIRDECAVEGFSHSLHRASIDVYQFVVESKLVLDGNGYSFLAALFREKGCLHSNTLKKIDERKRHYKLRPRDAEILGVKPGEHAGDSVKGRRIHLERTNDAMTTIRCYEDDGVSTIEARTD
jgi:hypothetical protein